MNFDFGSFLLGIVVGCVGGLVAGGVIINYAIMRAWDNR